MNEINKIYNTIVISNIKYKNDKEDNMSIIENSGEILFDSTNIDYNDAVSSLYDMIYFDIEEENDFIRLKYFILQLLINSSDELLYSVNIDYNYNLSEFIDKNDEIIKFDIDYKINKDKIEIIFDFHSKFDLNFDDNIENGEIIYNGKITGYVNEIKLKKNEE